MTQNSKLSVKGSARSGSSVRRSAPFSSALLALFVLAGATAAQMPRAAVPLSTKRAIRTFLETGGFTRVKTVDCVPGLADYSDFSAAMDALGALGSLDRNSDFQWIVLLSPCWYDEGNTASIRIPQWVHVACHATPTGLDASFGDWGPCVIDGDDGTGDFIRMGDSSLTGVTVRIDGRTCATQCGAIKWGGAGGGGYVSLDNVTIETAEPNQAGVLFDSTTSDRLWMHNVSIVAQGGDSSTKGLVFTSDGPGWVNGGSISTAGNTGGIAIEKAGAGDLTVTGTFIESLWTTQINVTGGTGDLLIDAVSGDGSHLGISRATPPTCNSIRKTYVDTSGALCWCNGSVWVVVAGIGTCT